MRSKDVDQVLTKMTRMFPWILGIKIMPFGCSKTVSKILKGFLIAFGKINSLSRLSEVLYFALQLLCGGGVIITAMNLPI